MRLGDWASSALSFRADVDLDVFVQNANHPIADIGHEDDVGSYPETVEGPVSAALDQKDVDALLAKNMAYPPEPKIMPVANGSDSQGSTSRTPGTQKKPLSKSAQERAERSRQHRRDKRRVRLAEAQKELGTSLKAVSLRRALAAKCVAASTTQICGYRHSPSGYTGYPQKKGRAPVGRELMNLIEKGFEYVEWDGIEGIYILDRNDRIIVCGGSPKDGQWQRVAVDAANAVKAARVDCDFKSKDQDHRRGRFPAMARGVSYGNGLQIPTNVRPPSVPKREAMDSLLENEAIKRIAGFQSCLLHAYVPNLGSYYDGTLDALLAKDPRLQKNFENSSFAAITVNFGPRTVSIPHVDHANLASGMCALTALGDFNPDTGGHLVLWDIKTIIRFPPGSTLLFPSALIKHSNIPIQDHEQRYSITQYSAGGLFRWVENGFCSDKDSVIPGGPERMAWESGVERLEMRSAQEPLLFNTVDGK